MHYNDKTALNTMVFSVNVNYFVYKLLRNTRFTPIGLIFLYQAQKVNYAIESRRGRLQLIPV